METQMTTQSEKIKYKFYPLNSPEIKHLNSSPISSSPISSSPNPAHFVFPTILPNTEHYQSPKSSGTRDIRIEPSPTSKSSSVITSSGSNSPQSYLIPRTNTMIDLNIPSDNAHLVVNYKLLGLRNEKLKDEIKLLNRRIFSIECENNELTNKIAGLKAQLINRDVKNLGDIKLGIKSSYLYILDKRTKETAQYYYESGSKIYIITSDRFIKLNGSKIKADITLDGIRYINHISNGIGKSDQIEFVYGNNRTKYVGIYRSSIAKKIIELINLIIALRY